MKKIPYLWGSAIVLGCVSSVSYSESEADTTHTEAAQAPQIERIEVKGSQWLPETTTAEGSFTLSRDFLDKALKGNGNVTDMLIFLPGVQGAENALSAALQGEIKSQLISISGAQPWQTSFVLDGIDNNSYLDPGSSGRSASAINDVQGHPEASFVNHELIGSVTVYDSNVPARYGAFNGGVVDMELRDSASSPRFTLDYRRSNSSWGSYHFIDERVYNEDAEDTGQDVDWPSKPQFDKESLTFSTSHKVTEHQSFTLSVARTTSTITDISLNDPVASKRESISTSLSYQLDDILIDRIRFTAGYSPYTGRHIIKNVKDSYFDLKGGGRRFSVDLRHALSWADWQAQFGWSESENSRSAPGAFLPWYRAAGKNWGIDSGSPPFSIEGGYGDLDKTQTTWMGSSSLNIDLGQWWGAYHHLELGGSAKLMELQRLRPDTSAVYSAPYRDSSIQCGGATLDCVEQSYAIPLTELAEQLGGTIDFSNPEHIQAYQDNFVSRGQYLTYRRLYLAEDINVSLQQYDIYAEHHSSWDRLDLTLGGRIDYDDFLQNLNASYRSRASLDVFGTDNTRINLGANRYYAANLITYKLREGQRPYITQYRPLSQGQVSGWISSSAAPRYRYRFDDVKTPYSDELSVGLSQRLWQNSLVSLRFVQRHGYDQITRGPQEYDGGYTYIYQTNEGRNKHDRISLSFNQAWQRHALTFNVNYTDNESNSASYDGSVEGVPEDELVVLQLGQDMYQLVSYDDLTRRQMDFSRPLTANLIWSAQWFDAFSSTVSLSYVGKFDSVIDTGMLYEVERDGAVCSDCELINLTYPLLSEFERPKRVQTNTRFEYRLPLPGEWSAAVHAEISNVFNQRTYLVGPGSAGIEVGREFWFGVNVRW